MLSDVTTITPKTLLYNPIAYNVELGTPVFTTAPCYHELCLVKHHININIFLQLSAGRQILLLKHDQDSLQQRRKSLQLDLVSVVRMQLEELGQG